MRKSRIKKKRKGKSTQYLIGIKTFTKNGLKVGKDELVFFMVQPTNQDSSPYDDSFCCA